MANGTEQKQPLSLEQRLMESSAKALEKETANKTVEKLNQGQSPNAILSQLAQTILNNQSSGQAGAVSLQDVVALAGGKVDVPGTRRGIVPAAIDALKGGEFKPFSPQQKQIGLGTAIQLANFQRGVASDKRDIQQDAIQNALSLLGAQIDVNQEQRAAQRSPLEMEKLQLDIERAQKKGPLELERLRQQIQNDEPKNVENRIRNEVKIREEAKRASKSVEQAEKLGKAVKRLTVITKQFNDAFPSNDKTPLDQRIGAIIDGTAAKLGVKENSKLLALERNVSLQAINIVRLLGEVGNISGPERQSAINSVSLAGLTVKERAENLRQFAEFVFAGADQEALEKVLEDPDMKSIMKGFGIETDFNKIVSGAKGEAKNIEDRLQQIAEATGATIKFLD